MAPGTRVDMKMKQAFSSGDLTWLDNPPINLMLSQGLSMEYADFTASELLDRRSATIIHSSTINHYVLIIHHYSSPLLT